MRISLLYENGVLNTLLQIPTLSKVGMSSKNTFQHVFTNINFWTSLAIKYNADEVEDEKEKSKKIKCKKEKLIKELKQSIIHRYLNPNINKPSIIEFDSPFANSFDTNPKHYIEHYAIQITRFECRCKSSDCNEKIIPVGAIRGAVLYYYTGMNENYNFHNNTRYYFHWNCFQKHLKNNNVNSIKGIHLDNIGENKKLIIKYFKELRREKLREEGNLPSVVPYVYCCDICNKLISILIRLTKPIDDCNESKEKNKFIDYCMDCFKRIYNNNRNVKAYKENIKTFTCDRCSKKIEDCIFHCQSCENHNLCNECFIQLTKEPEKQHEHCFFCIGKSFIENQNSNSLNNDITNKELSDVTVSKEGRTEIHTTSSANDSSLIQSLSKMCIKITGIKKNQDKLFVYFVEIGKEDTTLKSTMDEIRKSHPQEIISYFLSRISCYQRNTEKRKECNQDNDNLKKLKKTI
ncbi:hypothetical protein ABK040_003886 [Willaertia magna]